MENNKLIKKEYGTINKILNFFKNILLKKNSKGIESVQQKEEIKRDNDKVEVFLDGIINMKEKMACKLRNGEIDIYDLSSEEIDEMLTYLKSDTERKKNEIEMIKKRIVAMRSKILASN